MANLNLKRSVRKNTIILLLLLSAALPGRLDARKYTGINEGFVTVTNDTFIVHSAPFIMKGFNYYPRNYGWSDMAKWDTNEVKDELAKAAASGANVLRIFIDYGFSTDSSDLGKNRDSLSVVTFYHPTAAYRAAMTKFLELASRYNLRVIITLFDYMPGWAFLRNPATYRWAAKAYLTELARPFVNDTAIAAWDLLNEGDFIAKRDTIPLDSVEMFYREIGDTLRRLDTNHLITAGFAYVDSAFHSVDFVDFVSFHYCGGDPASLGKRIRTLKDSLKTIKPVVAEEIGFPSKPDSSKHIVYLGGYLDIILNYAKLPGMLIWSLIDFNAPTIQRTHGITGDSSIEKYYGIYYADLSEKPSVLSVNKFLKGHYDSSNRLNFKFFKFSDQPLSGDGRYLAMGFHRSIVFFKKDRTILDSILIGSLPINQMQGQGWYNNEINWGDPGNKYNGQWVGNLDSIANIYISVPQGTDSIRLRLHAALDSMKLQISYNARPLDTLMLSKAPSDYVIPFSGTTRIKPFSTISGKKRLSQIVDRIRITNLQGQSFTLSLKGNGYAKVLRDLLNSGKIARGVYIVEEMSGISRLPGKFIAL